MKYVELDTRPGKTSSAYQRMQACKKMCYGKDERWQTNRGLSFFLSYIRLLELKSFSVSPVRKR